MHATHAHDTPTPQELGRREVAARPDININCWYQLREWTSRKDDLLKLLKSETEKHNPNRPQRGGSLRSYESHILKSSQQTGVDETCARPGSEVQEMA